MINTLRYFEDVLRKPYVALDTQRHKLYNTFGSEVAR